MICNSFRPTNYGVFDIRGFLFLTDSFWGFFVMPACVYIVSLRYSVFFFVEIQRVLESCFLSIYSVCLNNTRNAFRCCMCNANCKLMSHPFDMKRQRMILKSAMQTSLCLKRQMKIFALTKTNINALDALKICWRICIQRFYIKIDQNETKM